MKARILPLDEIAEYGKTDTVVLTLSINSTEAGILIDALNDGISGQPSISRSARYLVGVLETVRDRSESQYRQDVVNTEARLTRYISTEPTDVDRSEMRTFFGRPDGTARGIHNLPGLHG